MYARMSPRLNVAIRKTDIAAKPNGISKIRSCYQHMGGSRYQSSVNDRVVVLGSGWGGFQLALNMNKNVPMTVVSPRNHFVFTPLLPSASVGTLECRAIQEPIRSILGQNGSYIQAKARSLDTTNNKLVCESVHNELFEIEYDKLVVSVGVKTNTFGIESVRKAAHSGDSVFFLKHLAHARAIRGNIIDCFEKASLPTVKDDEKRSLLSFVVVGGGPTSCEFTAELHDFIQKDVTRLYPDLRSFVSINVVEAGPALLGPFDEALQLYASKLFKRRDIQVKLGTAVTGVEDYAGEDFRFPSKQAILSDGSKLNFGTMVWSAGLAPRSFTEALSDDIPIHAVTNRIMVDEYLRVPGHEGSIWAIGDAAVNENGPPLPQLAQVARQQGIYLADVFNGKQEEGESPFKFFSLGSMAFLGEHKGIYDGSSAGPLQDPNHSEAGEDDDILSKLSKMTPPALRGFSAFLLWRFAYWGRQTSITNKILIPMHWFKTLVFGRDVSRY